jgi:alpha-1,3-rhamnosyl/mannosyltransferase
MSPKPVQVLLDTSPLGNGNALRGVGMYTRLLKAELLLRNDVQVFDNQSPSNKKESAEIIHYPFFDLFFLTLPFFQKKKTIVTIHDVIPLLFPKNYPTGIKGRLRFWCQRLALRSVNAIITDSHASEKDIIKYLGVPKNKMHIIYLAANPHLKPAAAAEIKATKQKYELPERYMLYVGDINYNKNIPQLIKSLKFLPEDVHLVCVGKNFRQQEIPEWKSIETQIALTNAAPQIKFLTEISGDADAELSALYSGAEVYVQPSLYEGFGLPVLEAMCCRAPVVCAKNSSLIEVAGKCAEFVEPEAESIAEGVKNVLNWSRKEREEKEDEAQKWASTFQWSKVAEGTVEVYKKVRGV